jgi:hypothetical protein
LIFIRAKSLQSGFIGNSIQASLILVAQERQMKKNLILGIAIILFSSSIPSLRGQSNPYDKYLTVADIEKVTGLSGVKPVPREPRKGAGGHLNFADKNGDMILIASFLTAEEFAFYRNEKSMVKATLPGVGDEAMTGPAADPQYMFLARRGDKCVALSTFVDPATPEKTLLTMDQLIALGKIVIKKL